MKLLEQALFKHDPGQQNNYAAVRIYKQALLQAHFPGSLFFACSDIATVNDLISIAESLRITILPPTLYPSIISF